MQRGTGNPLVPASILSKMAAPFKAKHSATAGKTPSAADQYAQLLQQNVTLAKENAKLKKRFRDLMDRKLELEGKRVSGTVTKASIDDFASRGDQNHRKEAMLMTEVEHAFSLVMDSMSQAQQKLASLQNLTLDECSGDGSSSHTGLLTSKSALRNSFQQHGNRELPEINNCTTTKLRRELDCKENVDPMSFVPKKKKTSEETMSVAEDLSFNECSGDGRSPSESSRMYRSLNENRQQQGDSRKRSRNVANSQTTKRDDELMAKTGMDLMSFAPKKPPLSSKSSSCRIGNMIVKRNSWNLSFQPLRLLSPQKAEAPVTDSSVYDFD